MSNLIFKIGGVGYQTWEASVVYRSMASMCGMFSAASPDFFEDGGTAWNIKNNDPVNVFINETQVASGYLDKFNLRYGPDYNFVEIGGRDKTMDLVDCSFDREPNEWKNQTIKSIFEKLVAPFNIRLEIDPSVSSILATIIETFKADEGDTVANIISRVCRDYGLLAPSIGDGKLTITKSTTTNKANDVIQLGINAKHGVFQQENQNRYSKYFVKGVGTGTDNKSITDFTEPYGESTDDVISRNRPLVIFAEGPTDSGICKSRAQWESMIRAGQSRNLMYDVAGWTQTNGKIWDINSLVRVKDDFLGIDETMLINNISYINNKQEGEISRIRIVHKDTYSIASTAGKIKMRFDV